METRSHKSDGTAMTSHYVEYLWSKLIVSLSFGAGALFRWKPRPSCSLCVEGLLLSHSDLSVIETVWLRIRHHHMLLTQPGPCLAAESRCKRTSPPGTHLDGTDLSGTLVTSTDAMVILPPRRHLRSARHPSLLCIASTVTFVDPEPYDFVSPPPRLRHNPNHRCRLPVPQRREHKPASTTPTSQGTSPFPSRRTLCFL